MDTRCADLVDGDGVACDTLPAVVFRENVEEKSVRTYLAGLVLAIALVGGVACSSEERASQEPPEPGTSRDAERTAGTTEEANNDASTEPSAPSAPEGRDGAGGGDAPEGADARPAEPLAQDPERSRPAPGYALVQDPSGATAGAPTRPSTPPTPWSARSWSSWTTYSPTPSG